MGSQKNWWFEDPRPMLRTFKTLYIGGVDPPHQQKLMFSEANEGLNLNPQYMGEIIPKMKKTWVPMVVG